MSGTSASISEARAEEWRIVGTAGNPPFMSGWAHHSPAQQVKFRRVRLPGAAFVELGGWAARPGQVDVLNPLFILPVGYRPPESQYFPIVVSSGLSYLFVGATGEIHVGPGGETPGGSPWLASILWPVWVVLE